MTVLLVFGHALLSLVLIGAGRLPGSSNRHRVVLGCSGAGILLGVVAALGAEGSWRTLELGGGATIVAGAAAACSWLLVGALDLGRGRWYQGALVGVGATGLLAFASNEWLVPGLLFWLCGSVALGAILIPEHGRGALWIALAASDVALTLAVLAHGIGVESWEMPVPIDGWQYFVVLAAVVLRCGSLPRAGGWVLLGSPGSACVPLLVGGAFVLLATLGARPQPWAAAAALVVALICAITSILKKTPSISLVGAWPVALGAGATLATTDAVAGAGVAALLATAALVLWPYSSKRGAVERGLLISFAPTTAGFGVVALGAIVAFSRAVEADTVAASAPWTAASALFPVALAAGTVLAMRVSSQTTSWSYEPAAVVATWALIAASIAIAITSAGAIGVEAEPLGPQGRVVTLYAVAVGAGALAARRARPMEQATVDEEHFELEVEALLPSRAKWLVVGAGALALSALGMAAYLTVEGLSVGFL